MSQKVLRGRLLAGSVLLLAGLFAAGLLTARITPEDEMTRAIRRHLGVILFIPSGEAADDPFRALVEEALPGAGKTVVIVEATGGEGCLFGRGAPGPELVLFDAHGVEIQRLGQGFRAQEERDFRRNLEIVSRHAAGSR